MRRFLGAASVALLLLMCPPFVDVALAQFYISTRVGEFDWTCAKDDGTPISGHTRWDKARESCEAYSIGNGLAPYRLIPAQYRFVATAAAQQRAGSPAVNVENTVVLPPVWRDIPPLTPFEAGVADTFDLKPYCYSPQGTARTITAVGSFPSGITVASGVLTIADTATAQAVNLQFQCDDGVASVQISFPIEIVLVPNTLREMGWGLSSATITEAQTYQLVYGREDTLFPDLFNQQYTADVDVTGCGITPIADTVTLLAYPGSGATLTYGYNFYTLDPPDVAADCSLVAVMSNFVNDTSGGDTVVAASIVTFTLSVIADDEPPGGSVYFTDSTFQPPTLETPVTITSKATLESTYKTTGGTVGITGSGDIYSLTGSGSNDLLIDLSGTDSSNVLTIPMHIQGWDECHIIGVEWDFAAAGVAGNQVGQLVGPSGANSNVRPRLPSGGGVIRLDSRTACTLEGIHVKQNGVEGDTIINRGQFTQPTQNNTTEVLLVNSILEGVEGGGGSSQLHGDVFQMQGADGAEADVPRRIRFENVWMISGQAGITLAPYAAPNGTRYYPLLEFRNVYFQQVNTWDLPNDDNSGGSAIQSYLWQAGKFPAQTTFHAAGAFRYLNGGNYNVGFYDNVTGVHYGASNCGSTNGITVLSGMNCAAPPALPRDKVGRFYVSPW